jgi:uncharacterized membrane protein (DUF2068 family)
MSSSNALRAAALLEASKGAVVLLAGSGLLLLVHRDVHALAARLVAHTHLNPAAHYPKIFVDAAAHLGDAHLVQLALGAAVYSAMRAVEAYGLFRERAWAELFAVASGTVYVPFELVELLRHAGWLTLIALGANLGVVGIALRALRAGRRSASSPHP